MDNELKALVYTIELRDIYTQGHSERVGIYAKEFGKFLGLDKKIQNDLYNAGFLHDLGKIGIPDNVLLKPTQLDEEEFKIIKLHSSLSADIVEKIPKFKYLAKIVKHHHENYDGSGYPDRLKKEEIPFESRILSIVDVFDALTTPRIYRKELSLEEALNIMDKMKNKFDPLLFENFKEFIREFNILKLKSDFLQEEIAYQLKNNIFFNDTLTKCLNREGLLTIIRKASYYKFSISLIEFNIKKFREYNLLYGLKKGDELLKELANKLKKEFKAFVNLSEPKANSFYLGRLKSDRFILLYIGHKVDYLKYKVEKFIENVKNIALEYNFLVKNKTLTQNSLKEIGYLF